MKANALLPWHYNLRKTLRNYLHSKENVVNVIAKVMFYTLSISTLRMKCKAWKGRCPFGHPGCFICRICAHICLHSGQEIVAVTFPVHWLPKIPVSIWLPEPTRDRGYIKKERKINNDFYHTTSQRGDIWYINRRAIYRFRHCFLSRCSV